MADVQKTMLHDERPLIERRILGAILLNPGLLILVSLRLRNKDFQTEENRNCFEAMKRIAIARGDDGTSGNSRPFHRLSNKFSLPSIYHE